MGSVGIVVVIPREIHATAPGVRGSSHTRVSRVDREPSLCQGARQEVVDAHVGRPPP
jgi:hypothetical protein